MAISKENKSRHIKTAASRALTITICGFENISFRPIPQVSFVFLYSFDTF